MLHAVDYDCMCMALANCRMNIQYPNRKNKQTNRQTTNRAYFFFMVEHCFSSVLRLQTFLQKPISIEEYILKYKN